MEIRVKPIVAAEWEQLRDLRLQALKTDPAAFGGTYQQAVGLTMETWQERAAVSEQGQQSRWFTAIDPDGRWVGMALAATDEAGAAHLFGMWVHPDFRGRGIAGQLCRACVQWAGEHGHNSIELAVAIGNDSAAAVYRKAGFIDQEHAVEIFGDRTLPVLAMRRST